MSTLTIRNLDDRVKQKLRERAASRGISMEQEIRDVLADSVQHPPRRARESILEDLRRLGVESVKPFDQKRVSDDMWDEGLR
jgi:plasmid stability protein